MSLRALLWPSLIFLLLGALSGVAIAAPVRIGVLSGSSESSVASQMREMRAGFREHGLVEGENISLVYRFAAGELSRLPALAKELLSERVDIIFAGGDQAIAAAKGATTTIPIVMVACDALAAGLVSNLSKPGGNLTGVTCINADLAGKRVELLKEVRPKLARIGLLHAPSEVRVNHELAETQKFARGLHVSAVGLPVADPEAFATTFNIASARKLEGIVIVNNAFTFFHRRRIAELALKFHVPTVSNFRDYVDAGSLMSYGPNLAAMYRQAGAHVEKIIKGASPGDLPVEQATRFELVINLRTAKALGIDVPRAILLRAQEVVQ